MAYVVLVVNVPAQSIAQLNDKCQNPTKPHAALNQLTNVLDALKAGALDGSVQVTVRSSDPSVATAGSGSTQYTYDLS